MHEWKDVGKGDRHAAALWEKGHVGKGDRHAAALNFAMVPAILGSVPVPFNPLWAICLSTILAVVEASLLLGEVHFK